MRNEKTYRLRVCLEHHLGTAVLAGGYKDEYIGEREDMCLLAEEICDRYLGDGWTWEVMCDDSIQYGRPDEDDEDTVHSPLVMVGELVD